MEQVSLVIRCLIVFLVGARASAQNTSCLNYLNNCSPGSINCCNYPDIMCLPDAKNGSSCLSLFDIVNLNPQVTGLSYIIPFSQNSTTFVSESINVNGKNVYNITETFTPHP